MTLFCLLSVIVVHMEYFSANLKKGVVPCWLQKICESMCMDSFCSSFSKCVPEKFKGNKPHPLFSPLQWRFNAQVQWGVRRGMRSCISIFDVQQITHFYSLVSHPNACFCCSLLDNSRNYIFLCHKAAARICEHFWYPTEILVIIF